MSKLELRNLIILFQENSMVTLSWGMHDVSETSSGITFLVKGAKYEGVVSIEQDKGQFVVTIGNERFTANKRNLIKSIDDLVELDSNFYNFSKK